MDEIDAEQRLETTNVRIDILVGDKLVLQDRLTDVERQLKELKQPQPIGSFATNVPPAPEPEGLCPLCGIEGSPKLDRKSWQYEFYYCKEEKCRIYQYDPRCR